MPRFELVLCDHRCSVAHTLDGTPWASRTPETPIWPGPCTTCEGTGQIRQEGQIGVPGSAGTFTCPDCGVRPVERVEEPTDA